jgi:hypothetical protein
MSNDDLEGDLTPTRPRIDLSDFNYTAERRAELERAGYVISQKRDGGWWWSDRDGDGQFEGNDEPLPDEAAAVTQAWGHMLARNPAQAWSLEREAKGLNGEGQAVIGQMLDELVGIAGAPQVFRGIVKLKPGETYTPGLLDPEVPEGYRLETDDDLRARLLRGEDRREPTIARGNLQINVDGPGLGDTPLVDPADLAGRQARIEPLDLPSQPTIRVSGPTHEAVLVLDLGNRRVQLTVDAEPIGEGSPFERTALDRARLACLARMAGVSYMRAAALTVAELDALAREAVERDGEGATAVVEQREHARGAQGRETYDALTSLIDEIAEGLNAARGFMARGDDFKATVCLEATCHNAELGAMQLKRRFVPEGG